MNSCAYARVMPLPLYPPPAYRAKYTGTARKSILLTCVRGTVARSCALTIRGIFSSGLSLSRNSPCGRSSKTHKIFGTIHLRFSLQSIPPLLVPPNRLLHSSTQVRRTAGSMLFYDSVNGKLMLDGEMGSFFSKVELLYKSPRYVIH